MEGAPSTWPSRCLSLCSPALPFTAPVGCPVPRALVGQAVVSGIIICSGACGIEQSRRMQEMVISHGCGHPVSGQFLGRHLQDGNDSGPQALRPSAIPGKRHKMLVPCCPTPPVFGWRRGRLSVAFLDRICAVSPRQATPPQAAVGRQLANGVGGGGGGGEI